MSENGRREIVEREGTHNLFIDELHDDATPSGQIIAESGQLKYKLIIVSGSYRWIDLNAITHDPGQVKPEAFMRTAEAIRWWKKAMPSIKVYLYPSMKGVL